MGKLRLFLCAIDITSEWVGRFAMLLPAVMMVLITYEVVMRYILNSPTIWSMEINGFIFCACAALSGAWVLRHKGHVNVEIIYSRFGIRARAIIDVITSLLFFLFIWFMFQQVLDMTITSIKINEHTTSSFGPPRYPVKIAMTVGVFLILLQGFAKFIRDLITAITGKAAVIVVGE